MIYVRQQEVRGRRRRHRLDHRQSVLRGASTPTMKGTHSAAKKTTAYACARPADSDVPGGPD